MKKDQQPSMLVHCMRHELICITYTQLKEEEWHNKTNKQINKKQFYEKSQDLKQDMRNAREGYAQTNMPQKKSVYHEFIQFMWQGLKYLRNYKRVKRIHAPMTICNE